MNPWMSYRCMKCRSRRSCLKKKSQRKEKRKLLSLSPLTVSLFFLLLSLSDTPPSSCRHTATHTGPQLDSVIKRFRSFPGTTVVDQALQTLSPPRGLRRCAQARLSSGYGLSSAALPGDCADDMNELGCLLTSGVGGDGLIEVVVGWGGGL